MLPRWQPWYYRAPVRFELYPVGIAVSVAIGCAQSQEPPDAVDQETQAISAASPTVCATGATVEGIDVSTYQGTVDWPTAKAGGITFGIARISDGLNSPDDTFDTNWAAMQSAGVVRGAYQFFEPDQDVNAQADMMIAKMATLMPGDLAPTLDVEVTDNLTPAEIAPNVQQWIDRVASATGRVPMVYTGFYFWRDSVGGSGDGTNPLWVAAYGVSCPQVPAPWTQWAMWQHSGTGSAPGVTGQVDLDTFNGDLAALQALASGSGVCGDGVCGTGETVATCAIDCSPCAPIKAIGGVVDDDGACFTVGGPAQYMRDVTTVGWNGDLHWTHATNATTESNFGEWSLRFLAAGMYEVDAYFDPSYAQSKQASYRIHHNGIDDTVLIDQASSAVGGSWQKLGTYQFAAGGGQLIHLGDNSGEDPASNTQMVFDAVRVFPAGTKAPIQFGGQGGGSVIGTSPGNQGGDLLAGCATTGEQAPWLSFGMCGVAIAFGLRRRRG